MTEKKKLYNLIYVQSLIGELLLLYEKIKMH